MPEIHESKIDSKINATDFEATKATAEAPVDCDCDEPYNYEYSETDKNYQGGIPKPPKPFHEMGKGELRDYLFLARDAKEWESDKVTRYDNQNMESELPRYENNANIVRESVRHMSGPFDLCMEDNSSAPNFDKLGVISKALINQFTTMYSTYSHIIQYDIAVKVRLDRYEHGEFQIVGENPQVDLSVDIMIYLTKEFADKCVVREIEYHPKYSPRDPEVERGKQFNQLHKLYSPKKYVIYKGYEVILPKLFVPTAMRTIMDMYSRLNNNPSPYRLLVHAESMRMSGLYNAQQTANLCDQMSNKFDRTLRTMHAVVDDMHQQIQELHQQLDCNSRILDNNSSTLHLKDSMIKLRDAKIQQLEEEIQDLEDQLHAERVLGTRKEKAASNQPGLGKLRTFKGKYVPTKAAPRKAAPGKPTKKG